MKKVVYIIIVSLFLLLGGVLLYNQFSRGLPSLSFEHVPLPDFITAKQSWRCLADDEYVEVVNDKRESVGNITVLIKDKNTNKKNHHLWFQM